MNILMNRMCEVGPFAGEEFSPKPPQPITINPNPHPTRFLGNGKSKHKSIRFDKHIYVCIIVYIHFNIMVLKKQA